MYRAHTHLCVPQEARGTTGTTYRVRDRRQGTTPPPDGIPVFDRNKVSLEFPGNLFGPSVSLLIRTTKIVGDVIQVTCIIL